MTENFSFSVLGNSFIIIWIWSWELTKGKRIKEPKRSNKCLLKEKKKKADIFIGSEIQAKGSVGSSWVSIFVHVACIFSCAGVCSSGTRAQRNWGDGGCLHLGLTGMPMFFVKSWGAVFPLEWKNWLNKQLLQHVFSTVLSNRICFH